MGWPGPMTHRQFLAWDAWLDGDHDRPSRADFYAMQVAAEVRRTVAKKPAAVKLKDFLLDFGGKRAEKKARMSPAQSKAVWMRRVGMKPTGGGPNGHDA